MTERRVLIVDDDVAVTNYLMIFLMQTERFEAVVVNDSRQVPDLLAAEAFDCLLLDMDMPHVSGIEIMRLMRERGNGTPVIVLTGVSDVELAVRAMKLSAFDYLTKPVDEDHLLEVIDAAIRHHEVRHSIEQLPVELKREDLADQDAFAHIPTQAPAMIRLLHQAETLAACRLHLFITGERGTGKEMLARAIHNAGPSRGGPWVVADASAYEPDRFAAAFFGQAARWGGEREERPGFVEEAEGGTLYLSEIEHLSLPMQVRLKRVLQTGEYYRENSTEIRRSTVRFIVSSSRDLAAGGGGNPVAEDLLLHLMINSLHMPPLRERPEDLRLLLDLFRKESAQKVGKEVSGFSPDAIELLRRYDFPDNVQELRSIVAAAIVNADGPLVTAEALPPFIRRRVAAAGPSARQGFRPRSLREVAREHARSTFEFYGRDPERAARELEIGPEDLERLLGD